MIVPLFGMDVSGAPSKSLNVNAQERLNLYTELRADTDKTRMALYCTPGLVDFLDLGNPVVRGFYAVGDFMYVVARFTLYKCDNAGNITPIGSLLTDSGFVSMVDNGTQLLMVDGQFGYLYVFATGEFATLKNNTNIVSVTGGSAGAHNSAATALGFPLNPITCTFQGARFIINEGGSGRFWISGANDGFSWDALDFATAETHPDNLIAVLSDHGEVILFGEASTEFWGNTGALDFPFAQIQGAALEWGLAAKQGFAKLDNSVVFLGRNRQNKVQVVQLAGHNVVRVSTHELEAKFEDYTAFSDATAFSYMLDGHPMFQINFNAGGESWLYDAASSAAAGQPVWSKVQSQGSVRHRVDRVVAFQNRVIGADYAVGRLYTFDHRLHTEGADPADPTRKRQITSRLRTHHVFEDNVPVSIAQIWLDIETGVGTEVGMSEALDEGAEPKVMFRYSKDHGHTWSAELQRSLGRAGEFNTRCYWNRLGAARDWVFEFSISAPVKRAFIGAGLKTVSSKRRVAS